MICPALLTELLIEGKSNQSLLEEEPQSYDVVMDASGLVVLPGLINTHHHFYQTLTRSVIAAINKPLFPWLTSLYPIWAHLTEDDIRLSTQLACAELLLSGCTTAVDHHYIVSTNIPDPFSIQCEAAQASGIRTVICRGSDEPWRIGWRPSARQCYSKRRRHSAPVGKIDCQVAQSSPGAKTQIALAPCSPFSVSETLMQDTATLSKQENVLLHTHLAETEDENAFCIERYGERPLDYIERLGWLDAPGWLAHGIHFSLNEIKRLGEANVGVSHCPSSNMILGSGICPVMDLETARVPVGLGVDGSASADSSNLMQEVRQALLIQRLTSPPETVTPERALTWGTVGGAN